MQNLKNFFFLMIGNTCYALAVSFFVVPNGLITGGTTGMGLFLEKMAGVPLALFVGAFNLVMFLLGAMVLGKKFALSTLFSTFYYPIALSALQGWFPGIRLTGDTMLAAIFAGLLIGCGIGLVLRGGASTGGMDIPPLILNKKLQIPVAASMYAFDVLILLIQMIDAEWEEILYGILLVMIYTLVLNKVLLVGSSQVQVKVVSGKYREISRMILQTLDRGTTLFATEGGHTGEASFAVMTIIDGRKLARLTKDVQGIDPDAFIVINPVSQVQGRGFTLEKKYTK